MRRKFSEALKALDRKPPAKSGRASKALGFIQKLSGIGSFLREELTVPGKKGIRGYKRLDFIK